MDASAEARSATRRAPFLFVVGCGRSGTTLLRAMLDSHPDLAVPAETKFILTMAAKRRRYERPAGFRTELFLRDLYHFTRLDERWGIPEDLLAAELATAPPASYPDAVRRVFEVMAARSGKPRYGNKTPKHVLSIGKVVELFPEARIVHVIRDGRDVAMSYLESDFGPSTIEEAALHWVRQITRGRAAGRRLGPGRYQEVLYESLVDDPEPILRSVCEFIELPYDMAMLSYHRRADEVLSGIRLPQYHASLRIPPTKGLRDWRSQMSREDVERFDVIAGRLLGELGYERAAAPIAASVRLRVWRRAMAAEAGRIGAALGRRLARSRWRRAGSARTVRATSASEHTR